MDPIQVKRDALIGEAEAKKESTIGDPSSQTIIIVFIIQCDLIQFKKDSTIGDPSSKNCYHYVHNLI